MAHLDATLIYTDQHHNDPFSRFQLQPQPSSDSLRTRLNALSDLSNSKCGKRTASDPEKHQSAGLLHRSKKLLQLKPQILKDQEDEVKKITRERVFRGKQQENAHKKLASPPLPPKVADTCPPKFCRLPNLPTVCLHPKRVGQQQLNLIKDQIQMIKQDLNQIYPDIPSPKPDDWFRVEELDSVSDLTNPTRSQSMSSKIPKNSRVFVEKSVSSLNRKIKSIKRNNSQSSSLDPARTSRAEHSQQLLTSALGESSSLNASPTPSLTNSSTSVVTPDINQSKLSPSFLQPSPYIPSPISTPLSSQEHTNRRTRHPFSGKTKQFTFPGSILEKDESIDNVNGNLPTALTPDNNDPRQCTSFDSSRTSLSCNPARLSIVTQGISDPVSTPKNLYHAAHDSSTHTLFRREPGGCLSPNFSLTPIDCLDHSIMLSQRKTSPFEVLADNGNKDDHPRISSSSIRPSASSARKLKDHSIANQDAPRSSRSLSREATVQFGTPNVFTNQPSPEPIPFVNSPSEIEPLSRDSVRFWKANFGRIGLDSLKFFNHEESPNEVSLVTDVLIEQQGGLSFLGQENFNERFRTKPWQTLKTICQYDRPGRPDAEYLPDVSRVEVVQTPHSPKTFPLPTPEWYWVTDFTIDRQSRSVDANGWEYYDVFSRKWSSRRHGCKTFIRRRRWVRVRAKLRGPDEVNVGTSISEPLGSIHSAEKQTNTLVMKLMKTGFEEFIKLNPPLVQGGHSLTINLPDGFPSIEIHWDDSSLIPQNPMFSSQVLASRVLNHLSTVDKFEARPSQDTHQAVSDLLEHTLAQINLQRVSKTLIGLSEHQKIKLWKYWLDSDSSSPQSPGASKPDPKDLWTVIDNHFKEVLALFVFDTYRVKFLNLVLSTYLQLSNLTSASTSTAAHANMMAEQNKQRLMTKGRVKSAQSEDQPLHSSKTIRKSRSKETLHQSITIPPTAASHPFWMESSSQKRPSFLNFNEINLDYWCNVSSIILEFKTILNHHPSNPLSPMVSLKHTSALDIRSYLQKHLKSQNKIKRTITISK